MISSHMTLLVLLVPCVVFGVKVSKDSVAHSDHHLDVVPQSFLQDASQYILPPAAMLGTMASWNAMQADCTPDSTTTQCYSAQLTVQSNIEQMLSPTTAYISVTEGLVSQALTQANDMYNLVLMVSQAVQNLLDESVSGNIYTGPNNYVTVYNWANQMVSNLTQQIYSMAGSPTQNMAGTWQISTDGLTNYVGNTFETLTQSQSDFTDNEYTMVQGQITNLTGMFNNYLSSVQNLVNSSYSAVNANSTTAFTAASNLLNYLQTALTAETADLGTQNQTMQDLVAGAQTYLTNGVTTMQTAVDSQVASADAAEQNVLSSQLQAALAQVPQVQQNANQVISQANTNMLAQDQSLSNQIAGNVTQLNQTITSASTQANGQATAAQSSHDHAIASMTISEQTAMSQVTTALNNLNSAVSKLVSNANTTQNTALQQTSGLLAQFIALASVAAESASSSTGSLVNTVSDGASNTAGGIGSATGAADQTSSVNALQALASIGSAQGQAAGDAVNQYQTLTDMLTAIHALVQLLKAQAGMSSDQASGQIALLNSMMYGSTSDMQSTLQDIGQAQGSQAVQGALALTQAASDAYTEAQTTMGNQQAIMNAQIQQNQQSLNQVALAQAASANQAAQLIADASSLAASVAQASSDSASAVATASGQVSTTWSQTSTTVNGVVNAIPGAINSTQTQLDSARTQAVSATKLQMAQLQNAGQTAITDMLNSIDGSSQTSINSLETAGANILGNLMSTSNDMNSTISAALDYANSTLNAMEQAPNMVAAMANQAALVTLQNVSIAQNNDLQSIANASSQIQTLLTQVATNLTNYAQQNVGGFQANINDLLAAVTAEASSLQNGELSSNSTNVLTMTNDDFAALLTNGAIALSNASDLQAQRYEDLDNNRSAVAAFLQQALSDLGNQATSFESGVPLQINQALLNATQITMSDSTNIQNTIANMTQNYQQALTEQLRSEQQASGIRQNTIQSIVTGAASAKTKLLQAITALGVSDADNGHQLSQAIDSVVNALVVKTNGDAAQLAYLQQQLSALQGNTTGLSNALTSTLAAASAQVGAKATAASAAAQAQIKANAATASNQMGDMGNRLTNALQVMASGTDAQKKALAASDAQAFQLAQYVNSMGSDAAQQVAQMLTSVQSGQSTISDILAAQSTVNVNQIQTVQDVATAFSQVIDAYLAQVQTVFTTEQARLTAFNSSVPTLVDAFTAIQNNTAQAADTVSNLADTQAATFVTALNTSVAGGQSIVNSMWDNVQDMQTNSTSIQASALAALQAAVSAVEDQQDALAANIISQANQTQLSVISNMQAYMNTLSPRPVMSLNVAQVQLPTIPDRI